MSAFFLSNSSEFLCLFLNLTQLAATSAVSDSPTKANVLEQRRCLLLAVAGCTAETTPRNPTMKSILEAGFLVQVKSWLDDILASNIGEFVKVSLFLLTIDEY